MGRAIIQAGSIEGPTTSAPIGYPHIARSHTHTDQHRGRRQGVKHATAAGGSSRRAVRRGGRSRGPGATVTVPRGPHAPPGPYSQDAPTVAPSILHPASTNHGRDRPPPSLSRPEPSIHPWTIHYRASSSPSSRSAQPCPACPWAGPPLPACSAGRWPTPSAPCRYQPCCRWLDGSSMAQ